MPKTKKTMRLNYDAAVSGAQKRRQKDYASIRHKLTAQKIVNRLSKPPKKKK